LAALIRAIVASGPSRPSGGRLRVLYCCGVVNVLINMADELQDISKLKVGIYTVLRFIILSDYKNNM
jgi:hypothetical protein